MNCRSCGAEIIWVLTQKGKRMPIDAEPREDGNIEIVKRDPGEPPLVRYLTGSEDTLPGFDLPDRYVSHFATCPHADQHRKAAA